MKTMTRRTFALTTTLPFAGVLLRGAPEPTGDLIVMTSGAFTEAWKQLAPVYENQAHLKLTSLFGPSLGTTVNAAPMRLSRGEVIDVMIIAAQGVDDLAKKGQVKAGTRVDLVRSKIALAVKAGAPHPDISSLEAFKKTVLAAKSIAYSDSASGVYLQNELFPQLGIWDTVKSRSRMIPATPVGLEVARGDAEIGFQQVSELRPVKGIDIVGDLPEGAQRVTIFSAAIPSTAKHPEAAKALIQWLSSRAMYSIAEKTGLEPIKSR